MQRLPIAIYLLLCLLLAIAGRRSRIGAFGVFLCSVIFTPLLVGLIFALLRPFPKKASSGSTADS
jgi:predicted MFS family arabinose efflux permease